MRNTDLYKNLEIERKINISKDFDEFYSLWTHACDSFFEFTKKNCKDTKIILNLARLCYRWEDKQGHVQIKESFKKYAHKHNYFRDLFESYLIKNYDVDLLIFDKKTLLDKNHAFGFEPSNYYSKYYSEKLKELKEIIWLNDHSSDLTNEIKKLKRENVLLNFNNNLQKYKNYPSDAVGLLQKYGTARIDFINEGKESNSIEILENSDENSKVRYRIGLKAH